MKKDVVIFSAKQMVTDTDLWQFTLDCNDIDPLNQGIFIMNDFSRPYLNMLLYKKGLSGICMLICLAN